MQNYQILQTTVSRQWVMTNMQ